MPTIDAATDGSATDAAPPLASEVARLLFELGGRLRAHLDDVAASVELTPMQARALHHLGEPCPMGEVADRLMCDASNVTGIVDRLEERGYVRRTADPTDRRRRVLITTELGERTRATMHQRMLASHPIMRGLDTPQLTTMRDLLRTALDAR